MTGGGVATGGGVGTGGPVATGPTGRAVAVVGAGLAGITAALRCADSGCRVDVLEARPRLGGLTSSFRRGDLDVDNGQHVFLRCCTSYLALLDRLAVRDLVQLQSRLSIPVRSPAGDRTGWLRRSGLDAVPAPYHLATSVLTYPWLSPRERWSFARAALALQAVDARDPATDRTSFGDWLRAHHQGSRAVEALWDLVGVATLNAPAENASLALAATVFQVGLLTDPAAADIGWSRVPLGRLHGEAAARALSDAGAQVRLRTTVRGVLPVGDRWVLETDDGEQAADAVVLAVPPAAAEALLPPGVALGGAGGREGPAQHPLAPGWGARLGASPIVNAHARYDREVLDQPFVAVAGSPLQWVFDRTQQAGVTSGQYIAVSISAAGGMVGRPTAQVRALVLPELQALLPRARKARLLDFFVTRERAATFDQAPGSAALRPGTRTAHPGLVLAGAWTDTGWPATMEGAVRSGESAAAALLDVAARDMAGAGTVPTGTVPTGTVPTGTVPTGTVPTGTVQEAMA